MRACCPILLLLLAPFALAQTPADISAEPHHRLLFENAQVRVFALTLPPLEQALTQYEHALMLITLEDGELVIWTRGQSPIQHYGLQKGNAALWPGGQAMGFRNDRTSAYHGVIVEFLNPKVRLSIYSYQNQGGEGSYSYFVGGGISPPTDPHAKFVDRMAASLLLTAADVQLLAGDSFPQPDRGVAELLVPVSDIDLKLAGDRHLRKLSGQATWLGAGRTSDLVNSSNSPARFIVLELHPDTTKQ